MIKGKRIRTLAVIILMLSFSLAACRIRDTAGPQAMPAAVPRVGLVVGVGEGDDAGTAVQEGLERALTKVGGKLDLITAESTNTYVTSLRTLADRGNDLIWAVGKDMAPALREVIDYYPDKRFVLFNGSVAAPNTVSISFHDEEAFYLAGILAGTATGTGRVGFITCPGKGNLETAFQAGVYEISPTLQVLIEATDGTNPGQIASLAEGILKKGADIFVIAPGVALNELLSFLQEEEMKGALICFNSCPGQGESAALLATIKKKAASLTEGLLLDLLEEFQPGVRSYGVDDNDLLSIESHGGFTAEINNVLAYYRRLIGTGLLEVPTTQEELLDYQQDDAARGGAAARTDE